MMIEQFAKVWKKIPKGMRRWLTRRAQPHFTVSAAGIVTNGRGEVLLLNHVLRPDSGWGLPGGFLNAGEQPQAAFEREIREETGLELSDVRLVHSRTFHRHIEIIFAARAVGEASVKSREITELGWFDPSDMPAAMSRDQVLISKALRPTDET